MTFNLKRGGTTPLWDCGDLSPLWFGATCRAGGKRGHVRALQSAAELLKLDEETENLLREIVKG